MFDQTIYSIVQQLNIKSATRVAISSYERNSCRPRPVETFSQIIFLIRWLQASATIPGQKEVCHLIGLEYLKQNDVLTSISSTVWARLTPVVDVKVNLFHLA